MIRNLSSIVIEPWLIIHRDENPEQLSTLSECRKDTEMELEETLRLHGETVPRLSLSFWSNWQFHHQCQRECKQPPRVGRTNLPFAHRPTGQLPNQKFNNSAT